MPRVLSSWQIFDPCTGRLNTVKSFGDKKFAQKLSPLWDHVVCVLNDVVQNVVKVGKEQIQ